MKNYIDIIMGVDPGVTTGICVCSLDRGSTNSVLVVIDHAEIEFSSNFRKDMWHFIHKYIPRVIVMESVVYAGKLNREKVIQIKAEDRLKELAKNTGFLLMEVTPEERKRVKEAPKSVSGSHARDAYRAVEALLRSKGTYENTHTVSEENEGR